MPTEMKTFYACEAYLGEVKGATRCELWLSRALAGTYNKALCLEVDLALTPSLNWEKAMVDDYKNPAGDIQRSGLTTIGPHWPGSARGNGSGHGAEAAVYLETAMWTKATTEDVDVDNGNGGVMKAKRLPEWPPKLEDHKAALFQSYQLQSRVYRDDDGGFRRYSGFLAEVNQSPDAQNIAQFKVYIVERAGHVVVDDVDINNLDFCDDVDWEMWSSGSNVGSRGPLFVRWPLASAHQLLAPKLPFGLGLGDGEGLHEEKWPLRSAIAAAVRSNLLVASPDSPAVNISPDQPDSELAAIQAELREPVAIVSQRWDIEAFVGAQSTLHRTKGISKKTLDLIAHSTARNKLLSFGSWEIQADQELDVFCARVRNYMAEFSEIRLIGCGTATSDAGQAVLYRLQQNLGIPAKGTTNIVYATNFAKGYYDGSDLAGPGNTSSFNPALCIPDSAKIAVPSTVSAMHVLTADLPSDPLRACAAIEPNQFFDRFVDGAQAWSLPGLMSVPLVQLTISTDDRSCVHADVLFNWQLLRVQTGVASTVFRITDPIGLRDHLDTAANASALGAALRRG